MKNATLRGKSDAGNPHVIVLTARALVAALVCVAIGNAVAADWEVWSETKDGMTGAQQITNALARLAPGDTVRVNPGTYDFTGIAMKTYSKEVSGVTYTITNHLARNCTYSLVGVTDGHWDDTVVFKGDARCLDAHSANGMGSCDVTVRNITFDGFDAGNCPCGGSYESRGGALRLTDSVTDRDVVSNCLFRNCRAYIGGAVNGGVLVDCLVTNNAATQHGGATCNTCIRDCRLADNRAGSSYGAFYGHTGLHNTLFENNTCSYSGGAGLHAGSTTITNCVFRGNTSTSGAGGALHANSKKVDVGDIVDCRFDGNRAKTAGGAIYQENATNIVPPRIRLCSFTGNVSSGGHGGAIYHDRPLYDRLIVDCGFTNNYALGSSWGGAVVNGVYSNCTFVGNGVDKGDGGAAYFSKSGGVYRCTFVGNVSTNGSGGALRVGLTTVFPFARDCLFVSNRVCRSGSGGAVYQGSYSNCLFTANVSSNGHGGAAVLTCSNGGAVMDCAFVGNVCWTNGCGGAVYCNGVCPFTRCAFTNNFAWGHGGALYRGACTNCTFVGNRCVSTRGASIYGEVSKDDPYFIKSSAVNCLFKDNFRQDNTGRYSGQHTEYQGGDVCATRMENCEVIDGGGSFWRCSMVNCHLHHFTNTLGHCVFGEENWVTNCLIDHCRMDLRSQAAPLFYRSHYYPDSANIDYRGRERGVWVNCTFADNTLNNTLGMFWVCWFDANHGPHAVCDFVNCIFSNNRKKDGTLADISGYKAFDVTYSNCVYGASDGTLKYGTTNGWTNVGGSFVCADPRFAKGQAEKLDCAYYTPRANSPVLGKGDASLFASDDVDLAGNPRLKDGKVDLGAYQSWVKFCGLQIILR